MQKEKALKNKGGDPSLNAFMMGLQNQLKAQTEQQKQAMLNPLVTKELKTDVGKPSKRKPMYNPVDDLEIAKQIKDLTAELKQSFFENKTIQKNTTEFEKKLRASKLTFDRIKQEKNLIVKDGILQPKPDFKPAYRKKLTNNDIPDFDKIKERENPLDSIVIKFEEKGYTPA